MSRYGWGPSPYEQNPHNMFPNSGCYPSTGTPGFHWVNSYRGQPVPANAVRCGNDKDGSDIYVGLANYSGDELPAKIVPRRREAYVCYDGKEIPITDYKILVEKKLHWQPTRGGHIPAGAIPAGRTSRGEQLYVGRRRVTGSAMAVGKVHPSHGCLYVPFDGKEMSFADYEILIYN